MEGSNLLQGIGLFVCVGAIILVAVIAFAMRALMGRRGAQQQENMWNTRGTERPTYDDPNVETRGGFGGVPSTGQRPGGNQPASRGQNQQAGFGSPSAPPSGGAQTYDRDRKPVRPPKRADDDDVRSSGGFGGG